MTLRLPPCEVPRDKPLTAWENVLGALIAASPLIAIATVGAAMKFVGN